MANLQIYGNSESTITMKLTTQIVGSNKPAPTFVSLHNVQMNFLDISWSEVTRVYATGFDMEDCVELLRQAPQLIGCSFTTIKPYIFPWHGSTDVLHHRLQILQIALPAAGFEDEVFDHFILPSLQRLYVVLDDRPLPVENVLSLLERSSCKLLLLNIFAVFEEETLLLLLGQIPLLRVLVLRPGMGVPKFSAEGLFKRLALTSLLTEEQEEEGKKNQQHTSPSAESNAERVQPVEHLLNSPISDPDEDTHQNVYLPDLVDLTYTSFRPEECEQIWDLIPGAFSHRYRKEKGFDPQLSIRPLRLLMVKLEPVFGMMEESLEPPSYISQSTLLQMKELMENGCIIDVGSWKPKNFIVQSVAFHSESMGVQA